ARVLGSTTAAIPSSIVITAKNGHETIQSARGRCRRSARASLGGAHHSVINCRVILPRVASKVGGRLARAVAWFDQRWLARSCPASCRCAQEYWRRNVVGKSTWALCSEQRVLRVASLRSTKLPVGHAMRKIAVIILPRRLRFLDSLRSLGMTAPLCPDDRDSSTRSARSE